MPAMNFKTIVLYNERRVRPQTLDAIRQAKDGDMIGCDPSEMDSFMPIVIYEPEVKRVGRPPKDSSK